MNMNSPFDGSTLSGTAGGTLLVLMVNINTGEIIKTMILAAIGALVSFIISLVMKRLVQFLKKK